MSINGHRPGHLPPGYGKRAGGAPAQQVTFLAPQLVFVGPYLAPPASYSVEVSALEPSAARVRFDPNLPDEWIEFIEARMVRVFNLAPNGMFAGYYLRECRLKTPAELEAEAAARAALEAAEGDKTDPGVAVTA